MTRSLFALPLALLLAACGGAGSGAPATSADDLTAGGGSCGGFKSAHCFCRVVAGDVMGNANNVIAINIQGQELFTYRIPGKCYNQVIDLADEKLGKGCWLDCRNAFGIDGHAQDPGVAQAKQDASKLLRSLGACGSGWMSAPLEFGAGTNKERSAAAMGIGIGLTGRVVVKNGVKVCE